MIAFFIKLTEGKHNCESQWLSSCRIIFKFHFSSGKKSVMIIAVEKHPKEPRGFFVTDWGTVWKN